MFYFNKIQINVFPHFHSKLYFFWGGAVQTIQLVPFKTALSFHDPTLSNITLINKSLPHDSFLTENFANNAKKVITHSLSWKSQLQMTPLLSTRRRMAILPHATLPQYAYHLPSLYQLFRSRSSISPHSHHHHLPQA